MKIFRTVMLSGCAYLFAASSVHAEIPAPFSGTFREDPGGSKLSLSMGGCGRTEAKAYSHSITLYSDYTFQQAMDLDDDDVSDVTTSGVWVQQREGEISLLYDGDLSQGTAGTGAWGEVLRKFESELREQCRDATANVLVATVDVKKLSMKLNKKRTRATISSEITGYAMNRRGDARKFTSKMNASGSFKVEAK